MYSGHTGLIYACLVCRENKRIVSASEDETIRVWSAQGEKCLHILEGHYGAVISLSISSDNRYLLSGGIDGTVRLWHLKTGRHILTLNGHSDSVFSVYWSSASGHAISGDRRGIICKWDLSSVLSNFENHQNLSTCVNGSTHLQYTNAKVLIIGEGDAGKTGLARRLVHGEWQPSDKTVGAWATQWKLPVETKDGVEREIWLWDFGGQADQRLIHQLYMDHTALAVLVFDGQKADFYESLGQWDRDLSQVSGKVFTKLLTAGRTDLCPLRVSRSQVEAFATERGYSRFIETSAQAGTGCEELKKAILEGIQWDEIPWRSSPVLFKRLKDEIIRLKDEGRVLVRFNELRECLTLRLAGEDNRFDDAQLKTVISLLAGPGVVWELEFGSWVLLQPELINAYAQGAIKTIQGDEHERGCVAEERVLNGRLDFHSSMKRLGEDDERIVLLAMHRTLLARSLCLRERTEEGALLIFPSFYRRERPELVGHPAVLVSYTCTGFLDDIYSTLVVRLHHTKPFEQHKLWRYAADFKTLTGKLLGVKLNRKAEGAGELEVYFDPAISLEEKIIFSKYVHEHLLANAKDVVRLRHYVCPHCHTPVGNREVAMRRLAERTKDILCVSCEKRVPLWDEMEELFASERMRAKVRELEKQSQFVLDNESKERALVGDVISTVALAAQISREQSVSDHGIDMHVEFKTDLGEATGRMVFLQLKSGDSFLRTTSDGAEVFTIKNERHVRYWKDQPVPVYLVIRNSEGEIRWMEIRDYLIRESENGTKAVKQIIFDGERFDVMAVRRLRERMLPCALPLEAFTAP